MVGQKSDSTTPFYFNNRAHFSNEMGKKMNFSDSDINEIKGYTLPTLHQGKECFVSFEAFDPVSKKMKRKKIMLGKIKGKITQRQYSQGIINRLYKKLISGWNPWIAQNAPQEYTSFSDVSEQYTNYLYKLLRDNNMREETVTSYLSYLRMLKEWSHDKISYIFQLNHRLVCEFLDYVFVGRNNTIQTRNNYLAWLKTFCRYLMSRCYISSDPTAGLSTVQRCAKKKNRSVLPDSALLQLHDYLMKKNKHYLLACYLLHYMFIRPHEMTYIKINDINLSGPTLYLHGDNTKNHNDAVLTIPTKVVHLMLDLDIFSHDGNLYLFSDRFAPGKNRKSEKAFRDYWLLRVRRDLKFPPEYKFYSLKDTGITNMLKSNMDILSVRDQARHSSILITDRYTPKDIKNVNKAILNYDGVL